MDLSKRSYQTELLDRDDIPFSDIERNMYELNIINKYLGGHAITIAGLKALISTNPAGKEMVICEMGSGGGDNLRAIDLWCKKNQVQASFIGIDINHDCIQVARTTCKDLKAEFIYSDFRKVRFEKKPDILFSSLFCHHFTNHEIVSMLVWMKENSVTGFFINDLHRNALAYHSIRLLSRLFSKSYLVKNDAPLSVARGFSGSEWRTLLNNARISNYSIRWKWAFRWLISVRNDQ